MSQPARRTTLAGVAAVLLLLPLITRAQQTPAPQRTPPLIRSQITAVPVDVRVLDRDGKPVTGLTAADFTVLEDGVPQVIRHFSERTFTPEPIPAGTPAMQPQLRAAGNDTAAASNRRVFLIILGRGRHQVVSKYVESLSEFIGKQLMPQDLVAVMAWNRATDFTNDHALIARILTRYRAEHEKVESQLRHHFSGLAAIYGSPEIPPRIQKAIDDVYADAAALRPRSVSTTSSDVDARVGRMRSSAEDIQRNEITKAFPDATFMPDTRAEILADLAGMPFDEYVSRSAESMQDLMSLYRAIDYLKYLEGEKHIVFLTEGGIDMPLLPGNRDLANAAADARIALNIVQTGGMVGAAPARIVLGPNGSQIVMAPLPSPGTVFNQGFSTRDLRMVADVTGGSLSAYKRGPEAFSRLKDSLGSQYLIAYAPARPATDGRFRDITIRVNRPGVRVQYRRGYLASARVVPLDRRDFITFTRIRAAARFGRPIDHILVSLAQPADAVADPKVLDVEVKIDVSKLALPLQDGVRKGALDVALYVGDANEKPIGEALNRVDLSFTEAAFQRSLETGAWFVVRVPVRGTPRHVKAVVYDYGSDLVGSTSAATPLKPRK